MLPWPREAYAVMSRGPPSALASIANRGRLNDYTDLAVGLGTYPSRVACSGATRHSL